MEPNKKMVARINTELTDPEISLLRAALAAEDMPSYTAVLNHQDLLSEKRQLLKQGAFVSIYGGPPTPLSDRLK